MTYIVQLGNGATLRAQTKEMAELMARTYLDAYRTRTLQQRAAADLLHLDAAAVARADSVVPTDGLFIPRSGAGRLLSGD